MKNLLSTMVFIAALSPLIFTNSFAADDPKIAKITKALKVMIPRGAPDSITKSAVPGLYEVVYGAQVIYVSADGRYMLEGNIFETQTQVNITEIKRQGGRLKVVNSIDQDSLIIYKAKQDKAKHVITVFTDIDCGYCRKLHRQMAEYNKLGIEMRYASFPRSGLNTDSYYKAVKVWCAKDPQKAMNFAKNGAKLAQLKTIEQVEGKDCAKSIRKHLAVVRELGITGTPTLVMSDGRVVPGYMPAKQLIKKLNEGNKS